MGSLALMGRGGEREKRKEFFIPFVSLTKLSSVMGKPMIIDLAGIWR